MNRNRSTPGFTLIEFMVVVMMLGLVSTVVVAAFGAGVRTWEQVRYYDAPLADAVIGLRILDRDIRNSSMFYAVPYECEELSLAMPAVIEEVEYEGATNRWVGTVRYRLEEEEGALLRENWPFPAGVAPDRVAETVLSGLETFEFSYLVPVEGTPDAFEWKASLGSQPEAPRAVRVRLDLDSSGETRTHVHTIYIPNR
jgi:prepilin-type N-terminal cleavage/methylation domain-containing protein